MLGMTMLCRSTFWSLFLASACSVLLLCASQFQQEPLFVGPPLDLDYTMNETTNHTYIPTGPLVYCTFLPLQFLSCSDPQDLKDNATEKGFGCSKWGGEKYEEVQTTKVNCTVLPGIECFGSRTFMKDGIPCIRYNGHHFVTTLLYSVLLGFLGMDRFCLGHTGTAVGKLLTLGGVGIWWLIDIVLLVTGTLKPADDSNWVPYF